MRENYIHGVLYTSEEQMHELALRWSIASQKMEISFAAEHGGGYPEVLRGLSEAQRHTLLLTLGYRVLRRWAIDNSVVGDGSEMFNWVALSEHISVSLTDGWVCREVKV